MKSNTLKPVTVKGIKKGMEADGWRMAAQILNRHLERFENRFEGQVTTDYDHVYNAMLVEGATFTIKLLKV